MGFLDDFCRTFCCCFYIRDDEAGRGQVQLEHQTPSAVEQRPKPINFNDELNRARPSASDKPQYLTAREHLEAKNKCLKQAKNEHAAPLRKECYTRAKSHGEAAINAMQKHYYSSPNDNKLDLHHYSVEEASKLLIIFLEIKRSSIAGTKKELRLYIITGKGLHSADGVPKIKNEVVKILQRKRLEFSEMKKNQGCLCVKLKDVQC